MLPTEEFLCLLQGLSYDSVGELCKFEKKLNLDRLDLDYATLQMGAAACVPIPLMVNILRDLKDGRWYVKRMSWKTIAKKETETGGKGKYCMFHWGKDSSFSGYAQDWKSNNELLGIKSGELVDEFACEIIKGF
jgi:hypothetical protein